MARNLFRYGVAFRDTRTNANVRFDVDAHDVHEAEGIARGLLANGSTRWELFDSARIGRAGRE